MTAFFNAVIIFTHHLAITSSHLSNKRDLFSIAQVRSYLTNTTPFMSGEFGGETTPGNVGYLFAPTVALISWDFSESTKFTNFSAI